MAVGEGVSRWKVGDRVCPIFMQGWLEGAVTPERGRTALGGGDLDGVLREYAAFDENGLVRIPDHLSYEEAATLPCAAVTAWHALAEFGRIKVGCDRPGSGHGRRFHFCRAVREVAWRSGHCNFEQ
jgi:NADPH:quinone reductase-like Zn-dependent oxidoreductase